MCSKLKGEKPEPRGLSHEVVSKQSLNNKCFLMLQNECKRKVHMRDFYSYAQSTTVGIYADKVLSNMPFSLFLPPGLVSEPASERKKAEERRWEAEMGAVFPQHETVQRKL